MFLHFSNQKTEMKDKSRPECWNSKQPVSVRLLPPLGCCTEIMEEGRWPHSAGQTSLTAAATKAHLEATLRTARLIYFSTNVNRGFLCTNIGDHPDRWSGPR